MRSAFVALCLAALSAVAFAQSVDGTWAGEVQGGRGPQQITVTLKVDNGKLTGTAGGGRGGPVDIRGGDRGIDRN